MGETAIEGTGTIEVTASGDEAMRRMDVRETHASLRSLARQPLLAAFRYQRRANETRTLTLDVKRFADAAVIAAVAERAVATTLVTVEGRMLTEVSLHRSQPRPAFHEGRPAGRRAHGVGGGCRRADEARPRNRWDARAADAGRVSAERSLQRFVRATCTKGSHLPNTAMHR